ncbi:MAG: tetratricopeptide repeat protein [Cytophagales bacterium]|nr:tetratricopeptide repeat protein [Cytophagales bacterium]
MIEDAQMQEIEDFLASRLPAAESARFREKMSTDAFLAREVDMFRDLVEGVSRQGRHEVKARLQQLEATLRAAEEPTLPSPSLVKPRPLLWWGEVAAVFLLGVCAYAWLSRASHAGKLFTQFYEPYPNAVAAVERGAAVQGEEEVAFGLYENGQYAAALPRLQRMLRGNGHAAGLLFYAGIASIELGQYPQAQAYLQQALRLPAHAFTPPATWYLALVHLRQEQMEQAVALLEGLATGTGFYGEKARALLAAW